MVFHSSFQYSYLWLPLVGFIIGFFASMAGGGGGFFFLPVLILLFKVPAQIAVATSLAATLPICIVGSWGHYRNGTIEMRIALIFALAGIIGAISGAGITRFITPEQLKTGFGIYTVFIALQILFNNRKVKKEQKKEDKITVGIKVKKITRSSLYGFLAGVIAGTFGTSGTAPVLAGLFTMDIPVKLVVGTSLTIIFVNTIAALGAHFIIGEIDLTLIFFLTIGTITGAFLGTKLLTGLKINHAERRIPLLYALAMVTFGILMILSQK